MEATVGNTTFVRDGNCRPGRLLLGAACSTRWRRASIKDSEPAVDRPGNDPRPKLKILRLGGVMDPERDHRHRRKPGLSVWRFAKSPACKLGVPTFAVFAGACLAGAASALASIADVFSTHHSGAQDHERQEQLRAVQSTLVTVASARR